MCVLLQEGAELGVIATAPAHEVAAGDAARVLASGGDAREEAARTRVIWTIDYDSLPIVGTALQAMLGLGKLA
jgi:hypothetical protein